MQLQAIKPQNRSQDEPMVEIESGETYSGIKFKDLNSWLTEVLQSETLVQAAVQLLA